MTVNVYKTITDQDTGKWTLPIYFRVIWMLTVIIHQISFTTAGLPNPPVKLSVSHITPSSLKLSWKPGNRDDIFYIVQYKVKADQGQYTEIKPIQKTEFTIEKLNSFQHYLLRAIAVTQNGMSLPSTIIEVVTDTASLSPPRNVRARPQDKQTIRIIWDEPEISNGVIQGYKVFYTANPDLPIVLWMNQEVAGENKMITISGLIPNSSYFICVLAFTRDGQGPLSIPVQVITGQGAPLSAPRNVRARPQGTQTIRIIWDEPEISNGVIQGYKVFYTTNPDLPIVLWMNQDVAGENKMTTISGLIPNSRYLICVLAFSRDGQGPLSIPVQVITGQGDHNELRNLIAKARGPHEIEVIWDATEDTDKIKEYTLYYNDSKKHTNGQVKILPPTTKYILTDLIPDTIYHIQLVARNDTGYEARFILVQAKTPEFIPNKPKRVQVEAINSTSIFVEWQTPRSKKRNGRIRGYFIFYSQVYDNESLSDTEKVEDVNDGNKTEAIITGLLPNTRYKVTVAGYTRRGDGFRSRPKIINTLGADGTECPSGINQQGSRQDVLLDYQIQYFKGMVERQGLERELMEVKLRMLKSAENKLEELDAKELLSVISEQ